MAAMDHPMYAKYFKMLKMGLPKQAVLLKMQRDTPDAKLEVLEGDPQQQFL